MLALVCGNNNGTFTSIGRILKAIALLMYLKDERYGELSQVKYEKVWDR